MRIRLERRWPKNEYTIGRLYMEGEYICNTLELPWRENRARVSCIPAGVYEVRLTYSGTFKRVLPLLMNVPKRSGIRIHRGNYPKDTTGCILPGENTVRGAVMNSKKYELLIIDRLKEAEARGDLNVIIIE